MTRRGGSTSWPTSADGRWPTSSAISKPRVKQIQFPLEYHAEIPTKYGELQAADTLVLWLAAAALLGVLLLLQTAVRSWKLALAVFLALPAALAGAAVAAWIGAASLVLARH